MLVKGITTCLHITHHLIVILTKKEVLVEDEGAGAPQVVLGGTLAEMFQVRKTFIHVFRLEQVFRSDFSLSYLVLLLL